jgi:O-antigen/teichoic acid export membrane protein
MSSLTLKKSSARAIPPEAVAPPLGSVGRQPQLPTGTKRTVVRNAVWNCSGLITNMIVGFFIAPFLIYRLGDSTYGLWIIIGSLTSYFGVLDLGVRGSVGRNVALHRERNDVDGINGILSTAVFYLCAVGLLAIIATIVGVYGLPDVIDIASDQLAAAHLAVFLVGLTFAVSLPLNAFDAVLWAYQRFDIQNAIDIPTVLFRAILSYSFIRSGFGLVALATITLGTTLVGLLAKLLAVLLVEPKMRIRFSRVGRGHAKEIFGYGIWLFILSTTRVIAPQVSLTVIGARLGTALVTPFSVALRLQGYANSFLIHGTQVLTPVATALYARDDRGRQQSLFLGGGRACLVLAVLFTSLFAFLGRPLVRLWMGPSLEFAAGLLLILAVGELLPMSQWITHSLFLAKGRHRVLAVLNLVEIAVVSIGMFVASRIGGLNEVCIAVALPAAVFRGVFPLIFGCRLVGVSIPKYLSHAFLPALISSGGPVLLLGLVTHFWVPSTWIALLACGGLYTGIFAAAVGIGTYGVGSKRRRPMEPVATNRQESEAI